MIDIDSHLRYRFHSGGFGWALGMYVCICKAVSDRQIRQAVREGARSVADLQAALEVSTGCGCCAEAVEACLRLALSGCPREREPWPQPGMASATAS